MNEFRKLMETLSRIEEGKFSELDIKLQELKARKPDATPEEIVAHIRRVMGDDAAEYVAKNVVSLEESFGEETYDEMVEYWKQSLSSSIVRKGVFTQMYDAAGQDIDVLNAAIEDEAHSIAERYHGSGEGIGTSDQNHFIASIARQLGIDDVFGWHKPKMASDEEMERAKAVRGMKAGKAIRNAESIEEDEGQECQWWAMCDNPATTTEPHPILGDVPICDRCVAKLRKIEGLDEANSDSYQRPYEDTENWEGKEVKIERTMSGEHVGETGKVVNIDKYRGEHGDWEMEFTVELDSGKTITMYPSEWAYDQLELVKDHVSDFMLDNPFESIEEAVVKVPRGLRGDDPEGQIGLTSQDAEDFINSLGPDDVVATDVVDPETGELLDWPDRGTRRARGQKEWERQEKERKEQEEKDHEEGYDAPYLYVPNIKADPERAWEGIETLKYDREFTDFYNIVWRSVRDYSGEPEDLGADTQDWADLDYDVDVDIPVAIKRKDGKKFNKQDRQNFDWISKIFKAATGNIGVHYIGSSDNGTVARFNPTFM